jgi:hypothetical protein
MTALATLAPTTTLLEAALRLTRAGYPVFPVIGKIPLKGVRWREDATTNEEQIRAWWEANPEANIGLPTGQASGFLVLDVDGEDGRTSLRHLQAEHGPLPLTHMVITPRGKHLYYTWQPGLNNSAGKLGKGLDIRGEGGYVVVPPSKRPEGAYRGKRLGSEPIVSPPAWLVDLLTPKVKTLPEVFPSITTERFCPSPSVLEEDQPRGDDPRRVKAAINLLQQAAELEEGERNIGTFKLTAGLRRIAATEEEWEDYRERLLDVLPYGPGVNGDFTPEEAERTIRSAEGRTTVGEWEPSGPLGQALTNTRREILAAFAWAQGQPWPGRAGTYNRLGYRAVLLIAYRVNRTTDLDISVREFGEAIGTRSLATASAVLRRLVEAVLLTRRPGETFDDPYVYDLVLRKWNTLPLPPIEKHSLFHLCNTPLVPDAFRTAQGLPKTALLLLDYLDEPRTTRELMALSGKVRSTILRNLKPLEEYRLVVNKDGRWSKTDRSLDEVARELRTEGATERQRAYNREQRELRDLRRNGA